MPPGRPGVHLRRREKYTRHASDTAGPWEQRSTSPPVSPVDIRSESIERPVMKFTTRNQVATRGFFRDKSLDFQARGLLGRTSSGAADVGEVLATLARISNHAQWSTEWSKTARIVQGRAETARAAGHLVSAGEAYLQAATYWAAAVDGITASKDSSALLPTFRSHRACWDGFID